jgi:3-methylfumaryl-CoA hydratase
VIEIDIDNLRRWIGRTESRSESITAMPAMQLAATLDRSSDGIQDGLELPPLYHWLYFLPVCRQSELGDDGHPALGGFLPPIPLPRRMWASSTIEFLQPLTIGERATRDSEILDVQLKNGRSGSLVFVKLQHTISCSARVALREIQELVYRDQPRAGDAMPPPAPAPDAPHSHSEVKPSSVLLFRYSALTFNAHRIHFDRSYATAVEGYPSLVVHGPLVATLLVDNLIREIGAARLRRFQFRALRPLFDHEPFSICWQRQAEPDEFRLWTRDARGALCTEASATAE